MYKYRFKTTGFTYIKKHSHTHTYDGPKKRHPKHTRHLIQGQQ